MIDIDMKFYNIYYFCNVASNLIHNATIDSASLLATFFERNLEVKPSDFDKYSILHQYCNWVLERVFFEDICKEIEGISDEFEMLCQYKKEEFEHKVKEHLEINIWFEDAIECYTSKRFKFSDWVLDNYLKYQHLEDAFSEYIDELNYNELGKTIDAISIEMFYILFQDRRFLCEFNEYLAGCHDYVIERVTYTPKWVQRAVFYRDKGRCVLCNADLTGLISPLEDNSHHYDHIVALDNGGINDVSNLQLLCNHCNNRKGTVTITSSKYKYLYDI